MTLFNAENRYAYRVASEAHSNHKQDDHLFLPLLPQVRKAVEERLAMGMRPMEVGGRI
jgi:hypothetical protein